MKINCRIIFGSLILLMLTHFAAAAQEALPSASVVPQQNTQAVSPPMGENDSLPFMRDERATTIAESSAGNTILKTLGAMLLIVGLIFFGAWGLRKFGVNFGLFQPAHVAAEEVPHLAILNSVNLGNGRTLAVVKFGERNLLIGSTAQNFTLLADEKSGEQSVPSQNRSVADLLAEENDAFENELTTATARLSIFDRTQI